MRTIQALLLVLAVTGCPPKIDPASPQPNPIPDTDLCGAMCEKIGPKGLKCEEGEPVYNSDLPGERGKPNQSWLDRIILSQAQEYLAAGIHFAKGSMAPKIQAAINFLEKGGKEVIITNPENIERALVGETGTHITP